MAKRDAHYEGQQYDSTYPTHEEMVWKQCEVCGSEICVNNWPDKKNRTPKYKGLIVCPECDPRHPEDRYMKEGYRVLHRRRARIIALARIAQAASQKPCVKGDFGTNCRCFSCTARKFFPPF